MGISKDSVKSHINFSMKQNLNFTLLSDVEKSVMEEFGVFKEKKMYGKTALGVERSVFILDEQHVLIHEMRGVKALGSAQLALEKIKEL